MMGGHPEHSRLAEFAAIVDGRLIGSDAGFAGVSTDTRGLRPGELFVALRGERFDGHEFVRRAAALGAAGAVVGNEGDVALPQVVVGDTLTALQRYAAAWRLRFRIPVIGVTGSNGKTTVKEMLAAILGGAGPVLVTHGNLNNHVGVPLTLLRLHDEHRHAVIEMGASHPGEIALLTRLARPDVGVITNAGPAHLEGFGSIEDVARAKGELFADLAADGVAVINTEDRYAPLWRELAGDRRQVTFGLESQADVRARGIEADGERTRFTLVTPDGEMPVELPLAGRHNVLNALAAAAAAGALGLDVRRIGIGLTAAAPVAGRLQLRVSDIPGVRLIDDSYNANPASLAAAVDWLTAQPGDAWLVLGDMAELGAGAAAAHAEAGRAARAAGVVRLFALGPLARAAADAFGHGAAHFDDRDALIAALRRELSSGVNLLVKGSRSARMDRVAHALFAGDGGGRAASC
jgi:UDP-N-acetylmuramoyl-tripeptide--D-alanyl-D-alanine ligase